MIAPERTVLVLLAAGRSVRYGAANKLDAEFLGHPLGLHVVTALEGVPFLARVAVVDDCTLDFASRGYTVIPNPTAATGMAGSVTLGVAHAKALDADAVLIALADMPRVTATHVYRLLEAAHGPDAVVASSDGVSPKPPALFGQSRFDFLLTLDGDTGARDLVRGGRHVVTSPAELFDIDTPDDLARLEEMVRPGHNF
jgi:molybdenum cofactor cytidylyltransferase